MVRKRKWSMLAVTKGTKRRNKPIATAPAPARPYQDHLSQHRGGTHVPMPTCRFSVYFPDSSPAAAGRTARVCQSSNLRKAGLIAIKRPNTLHCPFMGRVLSVP